MRSLTIIFSLLLIAACTPSAPASTPLPTLPALTGTVDIITPGDGAILYAESIYLSGIVEDVDSFVLRLVSATEEVIVETIITPQGTDWIVELVHGYTGDPIEVTIFALPIDDTIPGDYDSMSVLISRLDLRPEGVFGSITAPQTDITIGGDVIQVSGTASGLFEGSFAVVLEDSTGNQISQQLMTHFNPYYVDELPWTTDIPTNGYTGTASIQAYYQTARDGAEVTLDSVDINLETVAG